ncbi:hypothetical protein CPB97_003725 [Podila verticillata]|nr:hypothetical protein CPB97_003725 [Podila verticillata]
MLSSLTMNDQTTFAELTLGQRVEQENFRGTIRYLGPVAGTKGEWIGVEWDDKERGKHSGSHGETQYFECLFPGTGSFTRLSNKVDIGSSLLSILKERYVKVGKDQGDIYIDDKKVEMYDFDRVQERQRKLHLMKNIGLANTNVRCADDFNETQAACGGIEDLDMTSTLISTWQDVADICAPLTKLSVLRLNRNRFMPLIEQPHFGASFQNLRCLALNRVYMTWNEVELLEPSIPNLEMLQFGFNLLQELGKKAGDDDSSSLPVSQQKVKGFANLQDIHLEGNNFQDWNQILRLSHLPKLKAMDLIDNKIDSILAPEDPEDFKSLEMLRLNGNTLRDWVSFDRLGLYPALKTLWVGTCPVVTKHDEEEGDQAIDPRTLIVAKMEKLEHLNGSEIVEKSRFDSELYYLKHVALSTVGMEASAVNALHPRFERLCQVHGAPDVSDESRKATSDMLKDRLIAITFVTKEKVDGPPKTKIQRNVLGTMTVKNLKNLVQKLVKIPAMRQELSFVIPDPDYADKTITVRLKDDMRQISFYEIQDGVEIIIMDKNKT